MKILIISSLDVKSKKSWSGTLYNIYHSLLETKNEVIVLEPQRSIVRVMLKVANKVYNLISGKKINHEHSTLVSRELGYKIKRKVKNIDYDVIFAPGASTEIAFLNVNKPIIYLSDTTFPLMVNYYKEFSLYNIIGYKSGFNVEKKAINNANLSTFPSKWACDSAKLLVSDKNKIYQCLWGANLDYVSGNSIGFRQELSKSCCKLLFVGVDWERKGGDIAVNVVERLRKNGIDATLTIIGIEHLDDRIANLHFINNIGRLDKSKDAELSILKQHFSESHFFILPTKAECYGMVFAEASGFGTPSLSNKTGGVPSVISEGINGHTIENNSVEVYMDTISQYIYDSRKYEGLVKSTRNFYKTNLNWDVWSKSINTKIIAILLEKEK